MGSTGYLLYKAGILAQRGLDAAFDAAGLSYREFLVLAFATAGELSQQDVARRLSIDPTLVVGAVDALERRGLVERTRDPRDRRRYVLVVTAEGRRVLATTAKVAAKTEDAFLAPLSPDQRKHLHELVHDVLVPQLPWLDE
jgi:DNA-binding MarR family transcriptional regulator